MGPALITALSESVKAVKEIKSSKSGGGLDEMTPDGDALDGYICNKYNTNSNM